MKNGVHFDVVRTFTGFMSDVTHAERIMKANEEGKVLIRGNNDPEPSRVLGNAAAFMTMCGHGDIADQIRAQAQEILVDPARKEAGFTANIR